MISIFDEAKSIYQKCLSSCICSNANRTKYTTFRPTKRESIRKSRSRYPFLLLVLLSGFFTAASADPALFYAAVSNFENNEVASDCSACHGKYYLDTLKMTPKASITSSANTAELSLDGITQTSYSWFYRVDGLGKSNLFEHTDDSDKTIEIDVNGASESQPNEISVEYCIGQGKNGEWEPPSADPKSVRKDYNCTATTIKRLPPPNLPPKLNPSNIENISIKLNDSDTQINVAATDPNPDDTLTILATSNEEGVISITEGALLVTGDSTTRDFTIDLIAQGTRTVTISVDDGNGGSDSLSFDVTVTGLGFEIEPPCELTGICIPACQLTDTCDLPSLCEITNTCPEPDNVPPIINSEAIDNFTLLQNGSAREVIVSATDTDILSYSSTVNGSSVTVSGGGNEGRFEITPVALGNSTVTLSVTDGKAGPVEISFVVTVDPDNQPPIAKADDLTLGSGTDSTLIDVLDNDSDPDGDDLTIILLTAKSSLGGDIAKQAGLVSYIPPPNLNQQDTFKYKVQDSGGLESDVVTVTLQPSDQDGDGVFDVEDNCISVSNASQEDMDTDKLGDACDTDPDGDGIPGLAGQELPSGEPLVKEECLVCHNNPSTGAPQLNDDVAWELRLTKDLDALVDSVLNGFGAMPAVDTSDYTYDEVTAAVLYLSGSEVGTGTGQFTDRDLDTIADTNDNCPNFPNTDQEDSNNNGTGDACEPTADNDSDGYPILLDDDDSNASQLPGKINSDGTTDGLFLSENVLTLGQLAALAALNTDFSEAGIVMSNVDFLAAANELRPEVTHQIDADISNTVGIINVRISELSGSSGDLRIQLASNLPLSPKFRTYDIETGLWADHITSSVDTLSSTAVGQSGCPSSGSPNYREGLNPGIACLRLLISDGGPNDADGVANGEIEVLAAIGAAEDNTVDPDPTDNGNSDSSKGGGSIGIQLCLAFLMLCFGRWVQVRKMASHKSRH